MDLYQLKIFSMAARTLNFSKVASTMFLSPPSVTKYISSLEKEIGHTLFVRDGHRTALTDFGETFLTYVDEILAKEDAANRFLSEYDAKSVIRVGIVKHMITAPPAFFRDLLRAKSRFESDFENAEVKIRFLEYADLQSALDISDVDIAIYSIPNSEIPGTLPQKMHYCKLNHFAYGIIVPQSISGNRPFVEVISKFTVIAYQNNPAPSAIARTFVHDHSIKPKLIPVRSSGEAILRTASGDCAAFVAYDMKSFATDAGLSFYALDDRIYSNGLYALWYATDNKRINALADYIRTSMTPPD